MTRESLCFIGEQQTQIIGQNNTDILQVELESQVNKEEDSSRVNNSKTEEKICCSIPSPKGDQIVCQDTREKQERNCIDTRSILTNKAQLKRFWEEKMEMDMKSRGKNEQQQPVKSESNNYQRITKSGLSFVVNLNGKEEIFDENNNNSDNKSDIDSKQQQQQLCSDEEWRSLSPNVEPSAEVLRQNCNGKFAQRQQVSAELISEKLRDYQANGVISDDYGNNCQREDEELLDLREKELSSKKLGERVPNARSHQDEAQLLSIDPTLCHSSSDSERAKQQVDLSDGDQHSASNDRLQDHRFNEHEEQMINEEFSSSNSSFGPMSISVNQHQVEEEKLKRDLSEEDELSSAQSGSVLTVVANNFEDSQQQSLQSSETNRSTTSGADLNGATDDSGAADDESSSNIGVAFESLHFDTEIKSSKQEKVEQELLITPPIISKRTTNVTKFDANEVKSVCNFITAAISDASKQVENFIRRDVSSSSTKRDQTSNDELPVIAQEIKELREKGNLSSIQRATFVQESPISYQEGHNNQQASLDRSSSDEEVPKADLSSIFAANVRREIERFEANSAIRKPIGNRLLATKNGSTEWRIAEEIRQFNERESELKRRLESNRPKQDNFSNGNESLASSVEKSNGKQEELEAVVRFGKTLKIPKPVQPTQCVSHCGGNTDLNSSLTNHNSLQQNGSKSIRLTSVVLSPNSNQQQTTTISMHKFISSGGKRFVMQNTSSGHSMQKTAFTKSMSNLSTTSQPAQYKQKSNKTIDYKAVDSLNCKETPNVEPGMTRKAIETFSRMNCNGNNSDFKNSSLSVNSAQSSQVSPSIATTRSQQVSSQRQQQQHPTNNLPTAEWKIQEELREMRAREAELRDQRRHMDQKLLLSNSNSNGKTQTLNGATKTNINRQQHIDTSSSLLSSSNDYTISELGSDQLVALGEQQVVKVNMNNEGVNIIEGQKEAQQQITALASSAERLSLSSESLYPIKQTIDSFRRLDTSKANKLVPLQQQQHSSKNVQSRESEQQKQDDERSNKVGVHRKKNSIVERWENRNLQ